MRIGDANQRLNMPVNIKISIVSVSGRARPTRGLLIHTCVEWKSPLPSTVGPRRGFLHQNGYVVCEGMKYEIRGNDEVARQPFNFYDNFFFPLSGELIACLNENWQGKTSSLSVNIEIPYFCEDDQSGTCDASRFGSTSEFTTTQIPLDHWHDILRAMEWDDIEVFEVSRRSLINHEILTRALDEIRKVGNLIRGSHWEEAISEMSKAFEGLADSLANGGGSKTGYNQLLKLVFPNDDRRQSSYNEVLRALRTMANSLARHGKKEPIFVTREEALFYYSTAVSIMSVFGKALSDTKRADVV